jgi:beta-galactosidase
MLQSNSFKNKCQYIKKIAFVFILLISFFSGFAQNKASIGRKQFFSNNWKFFLGDTTAAKLNDFDDKDWRALDLPHDWSIEGQIHPKNPTGVAGGYFPAGIGWYRKTFTAPEEWSTKGISIYFEGVYMNSEVFINGKSLGVYPYGYSSFNYDLTSYLEFDKENVIAVRVDNSQHLNSRWYSGSGIYRHVWMNVTNPVHVAQWGVGISTPVVSAKKASVMVKTLVKNETPTPQSVVVKTQLFDSKNKAVGTNQTNIELAANSQKEITRHAVTANTPARAANGTCEITGANISTTNSSMAE